ncbi:MAG TPA: ABC transporter ATP-binding protein [Polyangia bacterium]|nr:ABC transporter ATP-binding protein [Polyangia bacterium]
MSAAAIAIGAQKLSKRFGEHVAIEDLTLEVPRGSAFALLGPNGAGKTTSVRMLTALLEPTSGAAQVCGHSLGKADDAIRRACGLLTEVPGLYPRLSAVENLLFFAELYDVPVRDARTRIERWLKRFELWDRRADPVGGFSTGMKQKLALSRALVHEPELLFLDEPTSGLDPESTRTVREVIRECTADGRTVVLCTHHLDEVERLCDRVAFVRGRVLAEHSIAHGAHGAHGARRTEVTLGGEAARFAAALAQVAGVDGGSVRADGKKLSFAADEAVNPRVVRALVEAGAEVLFVAPERGRLEALYFELVRPDANGGA